MSVQPEKTSRIKRIVKSKWSWFSVLVTVLLSFYIIMRVSSAIDSIEYGLTPPTLPEYQQVETEYVNSIGWPKESSEWFHHASQGTATIPIPYQWLVALEEPNANPWFIFFGSENAFIDEYILRLGFIKQKRTQLNPDGLPIGIAKTKSIYFPGIDRKATSAGFTCAACHTGQIVYNNKRYVIDGGPAMTDLGLLTQSLGAALGQTALSSKFSIFNGRFERFAEKVLGSNNNILTKKRLKEELSNTIKQLIKTKDIVNVTEGFTRLDALNRIGNQVFNVDMDRKRNYTPIDAPVNFPHIWTTSWFNWVQYDASIMQPLTRNTGEALGVKAFVDMTGPDKQRFASSVDIKNLVKIENWLGGTHPAKNNNQFNGLLSPKWPDSFPPIDKTLANNGKALYQELCQGCHLPTVDSEKFWTEKHWKKIKYVQNQEIKETKETYLSLKVIPLNVIGTDPAQASVLASRTVDTTGLNLNTEVCTWVDDKKINANKKSLSFIPLNDSATANFGLALGAVVERTNQQWFKQNFISESSRPLYEGLRPNCLQLAKGYKARPLNGVWATAPFLHNGSIATIYDLLSSLEDRPKFIQLGSQVFDSKHIGIFQDETIQAFNKKEQHSSYKIMQDYLKGFFILDTRTPGNHNIGHLFDDKSKGKSTIGRKLEEAEKMALIEYLKTL